MIDTVRYTMCTIILKNASCLIWQLNCFVSLFYIFQHWSLNYLHHKQPAYWGVSYLFLSQWACLSTSTKYFISSGQNPAIHYQAAMDSTFCQFAHSTKKKEKKAPMQLLERLRIPIRQVFYAGYGIFSLWFTKLWVTVNWITLKTCRIPFKIACPTGVGNLPIMLSEDKDFTAIFYRL